MRTSTLYSIHIVGKNPDKRRVIDILHQLGVVHISKASYENDLFTEDMSLPGIEDISLFLLKLNYIIDQTGLKREFSLDHLPKPSEVLARTKRFLDEHLPRVERLVAERKQLQERLSQVNNEEQVLLALPFSFYLPTTSLFTTVLYKGEQNYSFKKWKSQLSVTHQIKGKTQYYAITLPKKELEAFEQELRSSPLKKVDVSFVKKDTASTLSALQQERAQIMQRLTDIASSLRGLVFDKASEILFLLTALENYRDQHTISNQFLTSKAFFLVKGYCESSDIPAIKQSLPGTQIIIKPAGDDAPTKLKGTQITAPFQHIVEMFGTPKYGSADPTPLVTFFFPLFFGFMLSDVGYGLLLLLSLVGLRLYFGKAVIPVVKIFSASAITSILFGLVFGSFFGNLITIPPLYKDSFTASFTILIISLIVGLVHINIGMALKFYQMILQKKSVKNIFMAVSPYPLIQIAAALFFFGHYLIGAFVTGLLVAILIKEKSFFGLMDISGFLGIWLSYARLLALSLATSGVALAINIIAEKSLSFGLLGVLLWVVVIVFGHLFNFMMNILGCTIHSVRLHYVEFFSLFFEEGGYPFQPFRIRRSAEK